MKEIERFSKDARVTNAQPISRKCRVDQRGLAYCQAESISHLPSTRSPQVKAFVRVVGGKA